MASEKAKELARKQKAEAKAAKLAKKNSDNPADWGTVRQMRETYKLTKEQDQKLPVILAACFFGPIVLGVVLGIVLNQKFLFIMLGLSVAMVLTMLIFVRRAKAAAFKRYEGQAGSAEVGLSMLPKQWTSTPAIAFNRQMDVVHRTLGPGGLILIGEGEPGRLKPLLASEKKRHEQVAYGVDVQVIQMGNGANQVPLPKLADHIKKLPKTLGAEKITEIKSRLRALDSMRGRAPIPKGPMPNTKGARQAMRGR